MLLQYKKPFSIDVHRIVEIMVFMVLLIKVCTTVKHTLRLGVFLCQHGFCSNIHRHEYLIIPLYSFHTKQRGTRDTQCMCQAPNRLLPTDRNLLDRLSNIVTIPFLWTTTIVFLKRRGTKLIDRGIPKILEGSCPNSPNCIGTHMEVTSHGR